MKRCNAVFAGGGIRGIAHLGAVCALEKRGYRMERLAGTSAGAIVAALTAVGYSGIEAKKAMLNTDYPAFKSKDLLDHLGTGGKILSLLWKFGIYSTDYFESWMNQLLIPKNKLVFRDVREGESYRLRVTASDLTDRRLLVLPDDLTEFGIDPDTFRIARAVRMSMSIPIFFEPARLRDKSGKEHLIVDGGLLSNYPMWIMDDDQDRTWNTAGSRAGRKIVDQGWSWAGTWNRDRERSQAGTRNRTGEWSQDRTWNWTGEWSQDRTWNWSEERSQVVTRNKDRTWNQATGGRNTIPTFGFQFLGNKNEQAVCGNCAGTDFIDYMKAIVSTAIDAHDNLHLSHSKGHFQHTIWISPEIQVDGNTRRISSTDFDITTAEQLLLYENGRRAVEEYMEKIGTNENHLKWR